MDGIFEDYEDDFENTNDNDNKMKEYLKEIINIYEKIKKNLTQEDNQFIENINSICESNSETFIKVIFKFLKMLYDKGI